MKTILNFRLGILLYAKWEESQGGKAEEWNVEIGTWRVERGAVVSAYADKF